MTSKRSMGILPMGSGACTRSTGILPVIGDVKAHGQDAHATVGNSSTGILPVLDAAHGQDAHATLDIRQGARLPHWTLTHGGIYAVTFRLADSLPKTVLERFLGEREVLTKNSDKTQKETERLAHLHSEKIEAYLDAGSGACWLKRDDIAALMATALTHFEGIRCRLHAWCVMPNHVHVLVEPLAGNGLIAIVHSWKSFVANGANRLLKRSGAFWQPEYYDHLIRDEADYAHAVRYIEQNPVKAGLMNWRWVSRDTGFQPVEPLQHGLEAHATTEL